jgi:hypothetical protein
MNFLPLPLKSGKTIYVNTALVRAITENPSGACTLHFDADHTPVSDLDASHVHAKMSED